MNIRENIIHIASTLPAGVRLVAVSKTKPAACIEEAYAGGQRVFGENRPQEMAAKYQVLPKDIEWHLIGQLQEKNVKYIASFVSLIHVRCYEGLRRLHRSARRGLAHRRAPQLQRRDALGLLWTLSRLVSLRFIADI